jgi:hypothetical protein
VLSAEVVLQLEFGDGGLHRVEIRGSEKQEQDRPEVFHCKESPSLKKRKPITGDT